AGKAIQRIPQGCQRAGPQCLQCVTRYRRRHERVAVTVTSHPGAERQAGWRWRFAAWEGPLPGLNETLTEKLQDAGENSRNVVQRIPDFRFHVRPFEEKFAGSPEALETIFYPLLERLLFHRRFCRVLTFHEHQVNLAMTREH